MTWTKYLEGQTRGVTERPGIFAAATVIFARLGGERLTELLDGKHANVRDYFIVLVFGLFPIWFAYLLTRAIRELRNGHKPPTPNASQVA